MHIDPDADAPRDQLRMVVPPDKLIQFKQGIEDERDSMAEWLRDNRRSLSNIPPPASDPCSVDTMHLMSLNGQQAVDACAAYIDRLTDLAQKLGETAASYGLVEDNVANSFWRGPV